jgi:RNA polymerase primary sigma factor
MNELLAKYNKAKESLRQNMKRDPSRNELAKKLGVSINKIADTEMWIQKKSSIEAPVGENGESQLGDFLKSDEFADTDKEVERIFDKERIEHFLSTINPREKQIIDLRFGITEAKTHTLAEVAKILKVSRERVRQIEKEAIKKIKKVAMEEQVKEM